MKIAASALFACCLALITCAQSMRLESIEIRSRWGGLGTPQDSHLTVKRKGSDFVAAGKKIDPAKIDALLASMEEPVLSRPLLANLGITPSWLKSNAATCMQECVNGYISMANPDQKELFIRKFTDSDFINERLSAVFRGGWTDDYPTFEANFRFSDGTITTLTSDSQALYMIPWEITDADGKRTTYNAHISLGLLSILPTDITNARRLSGQGLAEELANVTLHAVEPEWKRLDVLATVRADISKFEKDYEIVSMELNSNHDSDFGTPWNNKGPIEKNLHIVLRRSSFPEGFALKLILPVENNKVQNIEKFQQAIDTYINLVNSVPWLKSFIDTSGKSVWLRFVKTRSLSEKGMRSFANDMKALGKESLAAEVEKLQDKVAVLSFGGGLEYYQSFWLVLPDGRSIVWRDYYVSPLPNVKFDRKECSENRSNSKPCVGALISRDGNVLSF